MKKDLEIHNEIILPNLALRIIIATLIIGLVLLLAQWVKDKVEQQENVAFQKISLHYQQLNLIGLVNNGILALSVNDGVATDRGAEESLRTSMNQLKWTQDELLAIEPRQQEIVKSNSFSIKEALIAKEIEQIIMYGNETLAGVEGNNEEGQRIGVISEMLLFSSQHNRDETLHYIANLTSQLADKNKSNQRISWLITLCTLLFVFLVSLSIYWRAKKLVHKQFNLINKTKQQLKDEATLRKDAEKQIARQANESLFEQIKYKSIINVTEDAIITITEDGRIDSFNQAAETMFGYSMESVLGKDIKIIIPEANHLRHDAMFKGYQETGKLAILDLGRETISKRADGTEFPCKQFISKIRYKGSDLFVGIIKDITQSKKAEDRLNNALAELTKKQAALEEEERIARHVFENITASNNDIIPEVSFWCEPMGAFSGDMMLSSNLASGGIRILLCDFTGHGLPAALGAVPVSFIHGAMAKKGLPLEVLMNELNNKLNELLPTGIFCCIAGIDLDAERTHAQIWNAGLPELLVVNRMGDITQRIESTHLPLGVVAYNRNELHCSAIQLDLGDSIYALSDGLTEAENELGEMFGQKRFEQLLMNEMGGHGRLTDIRSKIGIFVGKAAATDDISLIEIKTLATAD